MAWSSEQGGRTRRSRWRARSSGVVALAMVAALAGCARDRGDIRRAPEQLPKRTDDPRPAPSNAPVTSLMGHAGEVVVIEGTVVERGHPRIPWTVEGKHPVFVEVIQARGRTLEVVTHTSAVPTCERVRMTGPVIVARGYAKSGTTLGAYAEPQLDVTAWQCL